MKTTHFKHYKTLFTVALTAASLILTPAPAAAGPSENADLPDTTSVTEAGDMADTAGDAGEAGDGWMTISQRNKFSVGEEVGVLHTDGSEDAFTVTEMTDGDGVPVSSAPHPKQKIRLKTGHITCGQFDVLFKKNL